MVRKTEHRIVPDNPERLHTATVAGSYKTLDVSNRSVLY